MDVKEEHILGSAIGRHWYYVAKGKALKSCLKGEKFDAVLDVGAGSGVFSRMLLDSGLAQRAVCVDPAYDSEHSEDHGGREISFVHAVPSVPQKLVLMMDVLEHVDDDVALIKEYVDRMPAGGRIVITVPAFQFLWSGHDVFLEHRRRYTLRSLERAARSAGLYPVRSSYFFGLLFPVAAMIRLARRLLHAAGKVEAKSELKPAPGWLNALLIGIHNIERRILFPLNRFAGLTVFCVAERR